MKKSYFKCALVMAACALLFPFPYLNAEALKLTSPETAPKRMLKATAVQEEKPVFELRSQDISIYAETVAALRNIAVEQSSKAQKSYPDIVLDLFGDVSFEIELSYMKVNSMGIFTMRGKVKGTEDAVVIVIDQNNVLAATIEDSAKNYRYQITFDGTSKTQSVTELDVEKMPNLPCPEVLPDPEADGAAK